MDGADEVPLGDRAAAACCRAAAFRRRPATAVLGESRLTVSFETPASPQSCVKLQSFNRQAPSVPTRMPNWSSIKSGTSWEGACQRSADSSRFVRQKLPSVVSESKHSSGLRRNNSREARDRFCLSMGKAPFVIEGWRRMRERIRQNRNKTLCCTTGLSSTTADSCDHVLEKSAGCASTHARSEKSGRESRVD